MKTAFGLYIAIVICFFTLMTTAQGVTLGVVGSATPNGWGGPDIPLSYDSITETWTGNITLIDGDIKFRFDNNWTFNYGDDGVDGTLELGSGNIPVAAGNYYVIVDINNLVYELLGEYVSIPDPNFEQTLLDIGVDSDGALNGQILRADALAVTDLQLTNPLSDSTFGNPLIQPTTGRISDLTGIEAFLNLTRLGLGHSDITSVDLTYNTQLDDLFLNDNQLTSIDVSNQPLLRRFGPMRNPAISIIDVSNNPLLEELFIDGTACTSIDVSGNTNLWKIYARWGNLKGIDLSKNINLRDVRLRGSTDIRYVNVKNGNNLNVTGYDLRDMPDLTCVIADGTTAAEVSELMLGFSNGLLSTDCGTVYIPDPNFEQALIDLSIDASGILDGIILKSEAEATANLDVSNKNISSLTGLEVFVNLIDFRCNNNPLSGFDISKNTSLSILYCQYSGLNTLDVTKNTALTKLECEGNQLTSLDVTQNTLLEILGFGPNNLTEIDVSNNPELQAIWTNGNNLTSINLDANSKLVVYGLSNNPYNYVSLKNGNNANVFYFEANNTPGLDCINSDAVVSQQMLNSGKTFSEDCSTSLTGRWIIAPETAALQVGPTPGSGDWWFLNKFGDDISARACYLDDVYEFNADGSFKNILGDETYLEPFQGVVSEQCGVPVAPHDGSAIASYVYDQFNGTITINGKGAYLGLPKVFNGGVLEDPNNAPNSIIYNVRFEDNGNTMILDINFGPGYFTYKLIKESVFILDNNFEQSLVDIGVDSDGIINNRVLRSDAETVTSLNLNNPDLTPEGYGFNNDLITNVTGKIADLTGIEAFVNITNLQASYSDLTTVNVSNNSLLQELWITDGILESIDVSSNPNILRLGLMRNNISGTIDVSQNTLLEWLFVGGNQISNLDISLNTSLSWLDVAYNAGLSLATDIAGHPSLISLNLSGIGLANYNLFAPSFPNLQWLILNDNSLDKFNGNNALLVENLFLNNNQIGSLNLSSNTALIQLQAKNNVLTELDIRNGNNVNLTTLDVSSNLLTCISVDDATLTEPYASWAIDPGVIFSDNCKGEPEVVLIPDPNFEMALGNIDSDGEINGRIFKADAEAVTSLIIRESSISDLTGIEAFVNLEVLDAAINSLESINLSENTNLVSINIPVNNLSELQIFSGSNLTHLDISTNPLTTIDLSDFKNLEILALRNNLLTELDLRNNVNLQALHVFNNPNLFCIGVEDPNNISFQFNKDDHTIFSNDPDCIVPTILAQDVTIYLNDKGEATANALDFDNGSTDNVTVPENLIFELSQYDFDCTNLGLNQINFIVTDEAGNAVYQTVDLYVIDNIAPSVTAINSFTHDLNGDTAYTIIAEDMVKASGDNCVIDTFSLDQTVFTSPGNYVVTVTAADASGNEAQDTLEITIEDSGSSTELKFKQNLTLTIYPVPFVNEINILFSKSTNMSNVSVSLLNFSGIDTGVTFNEVSGNLVSSDTSGLPIGAYVLQITVGSQTKTATIIKGE